MTSRWPSRGCARLLYDPARLARARPAGPSYTAASPRDVSIRVGGAGVRLSCLQGVQAGPMQRSVAAEGSGDRSVTELSDRQELLNTQNQGDFSGLKAVSLHCTLKRTPEVSHTQA